MTQQTIVAYFSSRADAQAASAALADAGFEASSVKLLPAEGSTYARSGTGSSYDHRKDEGGFFASLGDALLPDEDRYAYAEGMSRGGATLTIAADSAQAEAVADIVERHGAIDIDEQEEAWRSEGWTGYRTDAASTVDASAATVATATEGNRADEVIPVVEERLRIGKRVAAGGRVRIRAYVVETPVSEQVNLRQERVFVERRPVDRPLDAADEALFRERVIEAEERVEEAVVSKEARVTEEIAVRKEADERVETVTDTVRRTEIEVEDERLGVERRTELSSDNGRSSRG